MERFALMDPRDPSAFSDLKAHGRDLDGIFPAWLHIASLSGNLAQDSDAQRGVSDWVAADARHLRVFPVVDAFDPTSGEVKRAWRDAVLKDRVAVEMLATSAVEFVRQFHFAGLTLDLDDVPASQRADLVWLTQRVAKLLHADGRQLFVIVPPETEGYDLTALASAADRIVLEAYGQTDEASEPGALSSQPWFEERLSNAVRQIPAAKLIVGFGSYAVDWGMDGTGEEISIPEAWTLLARSNGTLDFDGSVLNPNFRYSEGAQAHHTWMLDGVTAYNQIATAIQTAPFGLMLARLGMEDPSAWSVFAKGRYPDEAARKQLAEPGPGPGVLYEGKGEILHVVTEGRVGRRSLTYDPARNEFSDEELMEIPRATAIQRAGFTNKTVAITFDDGPSEKYTPAILEVLEREDVKATFFIIGENAVSSPGLVARIYREGHDIGNHTFTHPNLAVLSAEEARWELTATQRTIEAITGIRTRLFRPPFAEDIEPETVDHAVSLMRSAGLGYVTVGDEIDPQDWSTPGIDEIVTRVLEQTKRHDGNVILLHDGGGDRSETLAALPKIIEALKANDYKFATVHELIGIDRAEVMPPADPSDKLGLALTAIGLEIWRLADIFTKLLFFSGIVLGCGRVILIASGAFLHAMHARQSGPDWLPKRFSVLIPAYNEERVVCRAVQALLASPLKNFDIMIIDDGSTDATADVIRRAFAGNRRVKLLSKSNGGKASALNLGLSKSSEEIVVTQDADTVFSPDALPLLVRHFNDCRIGAVAGQANVGNPINWLTKFQWLEYVTSQNMDRRALALVNAITVVPGAIGAWRKSALLQCGGFTGDTLAEDTDATLRLEHAGWRVICENKAVASTEAPETLRAFCKQRFRWMFGTMQAIFKHRTDYLRPGGMGMKLVGIPSIILFHIFFNLMAPIIDLLFVWTIFSGWWTAHMHPGSSPYEWSVIGYWALFQVLEIWSAALAFQLDKRRGWWKTLPLLIVQRVGYRQILYWIAARSVLTALHGRLVGWNKLERTGSVQAFPTTAGDGATLHAVTAPQAVSERGSANIVFLRGRLAYNRAEIFRCAHRMFKDGKAAREENQTFGDCLRQAWKEAKFQIGQPVHPIYRAAA